MECVHNLPGLSDLDLAVTFPKRKIDLNKNSQPDCQRAAGNAWSPAGGAILGDHRPLSTAHPKPAQKFF
jgi:hypothetical protein